MSKAQSSSNQRWLSPFAYSWRHCWCCYMYRCNSSLGYRRATVANNQWYKPYTFYYCLEFGLDFIIDVFILKEYCPKVVELSSMFGQKSNNLAWESQPIFFKKRARQVRQKYFHLQFYRCTRTERTSNIPMSLSHGKSTRQQASSIQRTEKVVRRFLDSITFLWKGNWRHCVLKQLTYQFAVVSMTKATGVSSWWKYNITQIINGVAATMKEFVSNVLLEPICYGNYGLLQLRSLWGFLFWWWYALKFISMQWQSWKPPYHRSVLGVSFPFINDWQYEIATEFIYSRSKRTPLQSFMNSVHAITAVVTVIVWLKSIKVFQEKEWRTLTNYTLASSRMRFKLGAIGMFTRSILNAFSNNSLEANPRIIEIVRPTYSKITSTC